MTRTVCLVASLVLATAFDSNGADWPSFRGSAGLGVAVGESAVREWSGEENVRWKAALPRPGNGSPIVVKGRVLVTSSEDENGRDRSLYCFSAASGESLWVRSAEIDKTMPTHKTNPYGGSTPASDGDRVVVWHGSAGLHAYDLDGRKLWSRDLGEFRHMWGYGTSPILHDGRVILHTGPGERVFITAIDLEDGQTIWETEEPLEGSERNRAGQYMGSWSTPVIAEVEGREQIVLQMPTRVNAYDPRTGEIVWTCNGNRHDRGDLAYSSPVLVGDLCFVTGGFQGVSMAIRLGGTGDVTNTHRLWRKEKMPQNIGSAVAVEGFVYRPNAGPGTIECIDPKTGDTRWEERAGTYWASLVFAGGLLYAVDQDSKTTVFRPNPHRFDVVGTNPLPGSCNATPAVADGSIFIRTDEHLYCIGAPTR